MGVKVLEIPRGLGTPEHKVWVLPYGLGVEGHQKCVLSHRLGGPVDLKVREYEGRMHLSRLFGLWGVGGVNSQMAIRALRLRIYDYMAK
jgi:hypothetical protein